MELLAFGLLAGLDNLQVSASFGSSLEPSSASFGRSTRAKLRQRNRRCSNQFRRLPSDSRRPGSRQHQCGDERPMTGPAGPQVAQDLMRVSTHDWRIHPVGLGGVIKHCVFADVMRAYTGTVQKSPFLFDGDDYLDVGEPRKYLRPLKRLS